LREPPWVGRCCRWWSARPGGCVNRADFRRGLQSPQLAQETGGHQGDGNFLNTAQDRRTQAEQMSFALAIKARGG
jgi:hypothetical protein